MQIYKQFCKETFNPDNTLKNFELNFEDNFNFGYDVVDALAKETPDAYAVVWTNPDGEERKFTFEDISKLSNKAVNVFKKYGIQKGDRVMLMLKRNYEYWYVITALHKMGAVAIPATNMLTPEDIEFRVNAVSIKAVVCTPDGESYNDFIKVSENDNTLNTIFIPRKDVEGTVNLTDEIEKADDTLERIPTKVEDEMVVYFTSGTTGYPKAVMHNYTYPLAHIITARYWQNVVDGGLHFTVAETGWAKASWGKIYGQWLCGSAVMVYDFDNFSPTKLMQIIEKYKVTTFCAPPTVYRYFAKKNMKKYDLSSLTHISTAGEPLNPSVSDFIYNETGLRIMEGFGQSESTLILGTLVGTQAKPGSIGKPTPLYDVRLVDHDGNEVPQGETGEIVICPPKNRKQYGIFNSYIGDEQMYQYAWRGGVYHTKDTAYMDEDGYFYYVGRADDLIKSRGFRVGPFEIENIIMKHPAVLECAVIGVPDESRGQAIKAFIKLANGYDIEDHRLANEIKNFCNRKLASYKWIQYIEFTEEMPKTASGKIRRVELK